MKEKIVIRVLGAILLLVSFAQGHASRCCHENSTPPAIQTRQETQAMRFGPMEMLRW